MAGGHQRSGRLRCRRGRRRGEIAEQYGWRAFAKTSDLYAALETTGDARAVDIVTPTTTHHVLAKAALAHGCHVFVEKPIASTAAEGAELEALAREAGRVFQVGHVERFNPAFRYVAEHGIRPVFIEAHRLAQFNPRALDVSVVLDLMIHDIDLVLSLVDAELEHVSASGVGVVGRRRRHRERAASTSPTGRPPTSRPPGSR